MSQHAPLNTIENQTIAFAGLALAISTVHELATGGQVNTNQELLLRDAILNLDPPTPESVYGGKAALAPGFRALQRLLKNPFNSGNVAMTQYISLVISLERVLARQPETLADLAADLVRAQDASKLSETPDAVLNARIAEAYKQHISPLSPRIMVKGKPQILSQEQNVFRVRVLLLAAIRSVVLWRQCGGRQWKLALSRHHYLSAAERLLDQRASVA